MGLGRVYNAGDLSSLLIWELGPHEVDSVIAP